ncbi:small nuclear ribonucleoprotein E isoform X1 [Prionailurus iriomotensis]
MAYRGQGQKVQKVMVQPIVSYRSRIQVWLYEQVNMRIEGCIIGFDEYMNLVLDDAEEIFILKQSQENNWLVAFRCLFFPDPEDSLEPVGDMWKGRIMLKGDNITLLQSVSN